MTFMGRMTYFKNLDFLIQVSVVLLSSVKNNRTKKSILKTAELNYHLILYSYLKERKKFL